MAGKELLILFWLLTLIFLPGWAFLALTRLWQRLPSLQRWCIAAGIGIAFYPVLFYGVREVLPDFHLGARKMLVILAIFLAMIVWGLRKNWREQFSLDQLEWAAVGVFALTLFTRLWVAHLYPYPAWSDSLHHTLLTQLTAQNGQLPFSLEPYEPVPLDMYHLGLYSLSGLAQIFSGAPAHTALLWTAQVLNGFCTLGVYLILDARVGRKAALAGSVVVGLLSFQPAWYVNYGRFTQVASQSILLIAWFVTWEAIRYWAQPESRKQPLALAGLTAGGALLTASVFLFHFRVAGFYLPLLIFSTAWEYYQAVRCRTLGKAVLGTLAVGALSVAFVFPVLSDALAVYVQGRTNTGLSTDLSTQVYYQFSQDAIFTTGIQPWLFVFGLVGLVSTLRFRNKLGYFVLAWIVVLWLEGNAYLLNIPLLSFTNYGAVLLMVYLPFGLLCGIAVEEIAARIPIGWQERAARIAWVALLVACFIGSHLRVGGIEKYRHFMSPADEAAMAWVNANTSPDAVFAINTYVWNNSPHGIDGGYWLPYYTQRETTTGAMIYNLGSKEHIQDVLARSQAVTELAQNPEAMESLCEMGVDYFYLGNNPEYSGPTISPMILDDLPQTRRVYDQRGIQIYQLCTP